MRKRNKNWTPIRSVIENSLVKMGFKKRVDQYKLWESWDNIVGPAVSRNARPSRWQGNQLVITVRHSSWVQELSYLKSNLINMIKEKIPEINITKIRFEVGDITDKTCEKNTGSGDTKRGLPNGAEDFIAEVSGEIKDEETRKVIRRLITKDLLNKNKN